EPPLKLKGLKASKSEVKPGKTVKFSCTVENAKKVTWSAVRSDGLSGGSGKVKKGSFKWKPAESGVYTVTVKAKAGKQSESVSCTVIVRKSKLKVTAKAVTGYAMVGGEDLKYKLTVKGGCEPYSAKIAIQYKGKKIYTSDELEPEVVCKAKGYGKNKLTVSVTDALGDTVEAEAIIVSATNEKNHAPSLPRLGSDMTFAERLVAVARSQLGYRESEENFIYRDDGSLQGWSYYGGWYGMPYEEWCAMFVSFCLEKAGIGEGIMPHSANCNRWKGYLGARYIDNEDDYFPEAGDLIFYHHDRVSKDPNFPNHIGIVTGYDADTDTVYTVEGNSGKSVRTHQYSHNSSVIVGYASMRYCMVRWDKVYQARVEEAQAEDLAVIKDLYARPGRPALQTGEE
ncbi:MAG: CHAP domain-containing protein, partial [Clostridia bacterium]|nr:CHAP domain-containing protein [Clostridia bacterium]